MPDPVVMLSRRENKDVEVYAATQGVTPEELIKLLVLDNLASRVNANRKKGEVRTFRLPERE